MADIKFSCPHCDQHIQADTSYGGMQITCPSCQGNFIVPTPTPASPPTPVLTRPSLSVATPAPVAVPAVEAAGGCPSCGKPVAPGAVLCTNCGYNFKTGKAVQTARPGALAAAATANQWETPWYKTPWPYIGALVLVLGILYFMGQENPKMMLAFVGVALLYSFGIHVVVIITAFKEGAGTGFLTMCVPFYGIYFVFKVNENDTLKILYGLAFVLNIALRVLDSE